jgi:Lrp/AsnC family transcriptional regulator, leucine-responsive regulatory protein
VHLSPSAVARRQKSLEEAGVIDGYSAEISLSALGFPTTVLVHIALRSQGESDLRDFEQAVRDCPNVLRCLLMSGSDDYLLILAVKDLADFERVHKSQLSRLPNVSRIQSSFAIREVLRRSIPDITAGQS